MKDQQKNAYISRKRCNFRFKRGGETRISSPTPEVQATIERIKKREATSKAINTY